jgi:hypothetical protein
MVGSGILAYESRKERLEPLFFMLDTFQARQSGGRRLKAASFTPPGRVFFWPRQFAGLERAEMNRSPLCTFGYSAFETGRPTPKMSASGEDRN